MMKKTATIIFVLILIALICICNYDFSSENGSKVYELIFEGAISGVVTLGGLIFTFFKQGQIDRCPCIILEQNGRPQAQCDFENIDKEDCIDCCTNKPRYVRKVSVHITNVKNAWAINFSIAGIPQGSIEGLKSLTKTIILPSSDEVNHEIVLKYQDVYGKDYKQTVRVIKDGLDYFFVSEKPNEGGL